MSKRLEEQIRRYTEAMDFLATPLDELVPEEAREEEGTLREKIEITIPLTPVRRSTRPAWLYGVAALVAVLLLAIPIWLWVSDQPDVAETTPTTLTPPTLPESLDLARYPLVFDGNSQSLSGTGWLPNDEVVATLDTQGSVETRTAGTDTRGGFSMSPFDQCCADITRLVVTQGDRTVSARLDRGIQVNLFGAEREVVTIAYGAGFDVQLVLESRGEIYNTIVTPESDWWSVDLAGEFDVSRDTTVTAVLVRDGVAFVTRAQSEESNIEVMLAITSHIIEGQGFLPDTPFRMSVNGADLAGGLMTDEGGHFFTEYDSAIEPEDDLVLTYLGDTYEVEIPVLTFDLIDSSGTASGRAVGLEDISEVVLQLTRGDGSRREQVASGVPVTDGVWMVDVGPLLDGEVVEEAYVIGRSSLFGFLVRHGQAGPIENPENGHFYEAVAVEGGLSWDEARTAAEARVFNGVNGHLVTVTSRSEHDFLVANLGAALAVVADHNPYWLGGFQEEGAEEPSGGWQWVTGEPFVYENWADGEPNDAPPGERCLNPHHLAEASPSWNDVPCDEGNVGGYIVEYDISG